MFHVQSSDRLPMENQGIVCALLLTIWTAAHLRFHMCFHLLSRNQNLYPRAHPPETSETANNTAPITALLAAQVAFVKRDYELGDSDYDAWSVAAPVVSAVRSAALTWVR